LALAGRPRPPLPLSTPSPARLTPSLARVAPEQLPPSAPPTTTAPTPLTPPAPTPAPPPAPPASALPTSALCLNAERPTSGTILFIHRGLPSSPYRTRHGRDSGFLPRLTVSCSPRADASLAKGLRKAPARWRTRASSASRCRGSPSCSAASPLRPSSWWS
ncbi:unnamed protein product, partial [Ectocarpus sp. 8 AP-2014]